MDFPLFFLMGINRVAATGITSLQTKSRPEAAVESSSQFFMVKGTSHIHCLVPDAFQLITDFIQL